MIQGNQAISAIAKTLGFCKELSPFRLGLIGRADQIQLRLPHFMHPKVRIMKCDLIPESAQSRAVMLPSNPNGSIFPGGEPPPVGISTVANGSQLLALAVEQRFRRLVWLDGKPFVQFRLWSANEDLTALD